MGTVAGTEVRRPLAPSSFPPPCPTSDVLPPICSRYCETSASSGQNIQEVFDSLFATVVGKLGVGSGNNQK